MLPVVSRVVRTAINAATDLFAVTAGRALEADGLLPADHRPWPLPAEPWIMAQTWEDLVFLHWPVPRAALQALLPGSLEVETFHGSAWLAITPMRVTGLRLRGLPAFPGASSFPEINVRTYVTVDDRPGVVFFSLDAGSALAVATARLWYLLPYFRATCSTVRADGRVRFESRRPAPVSPPAELAVDYEPSGDPALATRGSLAWWLTERYCLYAFDADGAMYRAEVHHRPWPLQSARVEIRHNTMARPLGLHLPDTPLLAHFSARLDVRVWGPRMCRAAARAA
ncbi:MAG TPA: DUF2071 domain-containing protein [Methylomirabilota bacterium]|jgi:uncharacterized protein YqjF (DUF2071 family)